VAGVSRNRRQAILGVLAARRRPSRPAAP